MTRLTRASIALSKKLDDSVSLQFEVSTKTGTENVTHTLRALTSIDDRTTHCVCSRQWRLLIFRTRRWGTKWCGCLEISVNRRPVKIVLWARSAKSASELFPTTCTQLTSASGVDDQALQRSRSDCCALSRLVGPPTTQRWSTMSGARAFAHSSTRFVTGLTILSCGGMGFKHCASTQINVPCSALGRTAEILNGAMRASCVGPLGGSEG